MENIKNPLTPAQAKCLKLIHSGKRTRSDLSSSLGYSDATTFWILKNLEAMGRIIISPDGTISLPEFNQAAPVKNRSGRRKK